MGSYYQGGTFALYDLFVFVYIGLLPWYVKGKEYLY